MATYKKYFDTRNKNAERWPLKIKISHKGIPDYIGTGYHLKPNELNSELRVQKPYNNAGEANAEIDRIMAITGEVILKLRPILKTITVKELKVAIEARIDKEFKQKLDEENPDLEESIEEAEDSDSPDFYVYAQAVADSFYDTDRGGSGKTILGAIKSLKAYNGKESLRFSDITPAFLQSYEEWYLRQINKEGKLNTLNGLGFHTKEIRRVYNLAIEDEECKVKEEQYPFNRGKGKKGQSGKYRIRKEKTEHRNIEASEIKKIYDLKLTPKTRLWHHQNYFKFYFECWGMNFMDIAHLRVYQIKNGKLTYRRRKTRWTDNAKRFHIKLSPIAQEIADFYCQGKKNQDFLFPIIHHIEHLRFTDGKEFQHKLDMIGANHCVRLKSISKKAGLEEEATPYKGRHSFASIALVNKVPKSEIGEMLGHASYETTETYLEGFADQQLYESASRVMEAVHPKETELDQLQDELRLADGKTCTVFDFFMSSMTGKEPKDGVGLLIDMVSKTNVVDGGKAQMYVDIFQNVYEKQLMAS